MHNIDLIHSKVLLLKGSEKAWDRVCEKGGMAYQLCPRFMTRKWGVWLTKTARPLARDGNSRCAATANTLKARELAGHSRVLFSLGTVCR